MNIRKKILDYKTQKFDLLNFRKEVASIRDNAALIVIGEDCVFKLGISEFEVHQDVMRKILKAIGINYYFLNYDMTWAEDISKSYNLVIIRIIRDMDIIYIPEFMNSYQLDELKKYRDEAKKVDNLLNFKREIKLFDCSNNKSLECDLDEYLENKLFQKVK